MIYVKYNTVDHIADAYQTQSSMPHHLLHKCDKNNNNDDLTFFVDM